MAAPPGFKKRLVFAVTNDLTYDQRMARICGSLQGAGYEVLLVGRRLQSSVPLAQKAFRQKRLRCFFEKGKLFYLEYNLRLAIYLLWQPMDLICAIDLDTILPCYIVSALRRKKRVYDAHELFCEMKEIVTRPVVQAVWKRIERLAVPRFANGYTVSEPIRQVLERDYGRRYSLVMNVPPLQALTATTSNGFVLYQGAVNEGRSFETLVPAFQWVDAELHIYGDGNFYTACQDLIRQHGLEKKVLLKGLALPATLRTITPTAAVGLTLFEAKGQSNLYSLANRFFDYIHAGVPQVCVNYPAYAEINRRFEVALLVDDLSPQALAQAINRLLHDEPLRQRLMRNCLAAREVYNWQQEEQRLLHFYRQLFPA